MPCEEGDLSAFSFSCFLVSYLHMSSWVRDGGWDGEFVVTPEPKKKKKTELRLLGEVDDVFASWF